MLLNYRDFKNMHFSHTMNSLIYFSLAGLYLQVDDKILVQDLADVCSKSTMMTFVNQIQAAYPPNIITSYTKEVDFCSIFEVKQQEEVEEGISLLLLR